MSGGRFFRWLWTTRIPGPGLWTDTGCASLMLCTHTGNASRGHRARPARIELTSPAGLR